MTVSLPLQRQVTDWDEYTGHLQSPEMATVQARVSGFVQEAPFKEGALVHKGDTLFVIDDRPFKADFENKKAAVAKDQASIDLTKAQLSRYSDLLQKKAVSQQDYDTNKAGFDQATAQLAADQAALETSRLNLEWTHVAAPIDGRVGRIEVTVGNLVTGGSGQMSVLTSVVSIDPIYCYAPVPERNFLKYQHYAESSTGKGVREAKIPCFIKLENETQFGHEGVIDFIDNQLDPKTGTIQVRGVIPNPSGELTPGLFAQMRITGTGPYNALLVPDASVGTEQAERFLLVVDAEGVVASRRVKLGRLFGSLRVVSEGLKEGERVIVNGLQMARPGSKVVAKEEPISAAAIAELEVPSGTHTEARR